MNEAVRRVEEYCRQAGMKPESPLCLALLTVMEAASDAREAVKGGARGLTAEGEAQLIERVAEAASDATDRRGTGIVRAQTAGMAFKLAAAGLLIAAGGYGAGGWHAGASRAAAIEGAGFMAQLTELNDPAALREYCLKHATAQQGGTACELPMVWVKSPARR